MRELPSGTVTFLFTDVEGSTRLLHELGGERYAEALGEHRRLVRAAVERHRGVEVDTEGDAFFVAFARASDAVAAAREAQEALAEGPIRVRMGLHTGEPLVVENDYVGIDVHRAARVMAAGHGGQVLLTQTTRDLLDDVPVRDLGDHRLKDLTQPQRLYQLLGEGLAADFPPPKTLENRPTNLPVQPTALVGRERELRDVLALLGREHVRLVTLTGPGGSGKTRLALQAGAELIEHYSYGVWFVNLAALTDPELVVPTIAQTLAVKERPGETIAETLAERLREQELLLVLDNFEQVAEAGVQLAEVLAYAPAINVIVTSRASLHLSGEHEYAVPPLADEEALALFAERAQAAKASFTLNGNRVSVAEICRRLDQLPLAIELAAARIKVLPEKALLERLNDRLKLLTGGARDVDERQRTLRAAIDWSYRLLSPDEQRLFARLSVFAGGRALEAIEAICNPERDLDVFEGVASLVDKSLLRQEESAEHEPRYVMLETIHEYARERLGELGETAELRRRHAAYFARLAEEAEPALRGRDQTVWLSLLEVERENLRAALASSRDLEDEELRSRIALSMGRFWEMRGPFAEARAWSEHVARINPSPGSRAEALVRVARVAGLQGDRHTQETAAREAANLFGAVGDKSGLGNALNALANAANEQRRYDEGVALLEEAAGLARDVGDRSLESACINNLAVVAQERGEYERAIPMLEQSLEIDRELGDSYGMMYALLNLGIATLAARKESAALAHSRRGLELAVKLDSGYGVGWGIDVLAKIAAARGELDRAARLFASSASLLESVGAELGVSDRHATDDVIAKLQAQVGDSDFERAWAEGAALDREAAVGYALDVLPLEDATRSAS